MNRRSLILFGLAACLVPTGVASQASDWPSKKVITIVVPIAPGGSSDVTARLLAENLSKELGQSVIVENRPGAGGNIGAAGVARAEPDGYTLLFYTNTLATNVSLYKNMGFDLKKDLLPISQMSVIPVVLVTNNEVPAKSLQEFIAFAKQKKGDMNFGSAGNGTSSHLAAALFNSMAEVEMSHVPYRGGAPANADLMGGRVQAVFAPMIEVLSLVEGGKLRALGVTTKSRSSRLPDVPPIAEVLPGYEFVLWNGVFAPAGTPPEVVDRLAAAIAKATQDPTVQKKLTDQGSVPVSNTPAEFKKILDEEIEKSAKLVKLSGARVE